MRRVAVYWERKGGRLKIAELAQKKGSGVVFEWDGDFLNIQIERLPVVFN